MVRPPDQRDTLAQGNNSRRTRSGRIVGTISGQSVNSSNEEGNWRTNQRRSGEEHMGTCGAGIHVTPNTRPRAHTHTAHTHTQHHVHAWVWGEVVRR